MPDTALLQTTLGKIDSVLTPPARQPRPPTVLERAWLELGTAALGIIPAKVYGCPDELDAINLSKDLEVVERQLTKLLFAYADYSVENVWADREAFTQALNQISDAFSDMRGGLYAAGRKITEDREAVR